MATKKTPGPLMQKVKARITRTKAEAKAATVGAATAVKKQVSGVKNAVAAMRDNRKNKIELKKAGKPKDSTVGYNVAEAFSAGKSKVFDSGRPNASVGRARIKSAKQKKAGRIVYKDRQAYELSPNRREAINELISMRTDKGAEKATPRELRRKARQDYRAADKPTTMKEMRKQNKKKGRSASRATCKPGRGVNLCNTPVEGGL